MAGVHNFTLDAGSDKTKTFAYKDSNNAAIDLTGYSAKAQLRPTYSGAVALELSTANGKIALGGAAGTIALTFSNTDTGALSAPTYLYDVEVTSGGGTVTRVVEGVITVDPEVTR